VKWHLKAPVFAISSLAAAQHMLYFGGRDGSLFAVDAALFPLDAQTGQEQ
jgi:hypothetical protein